MYDAVEIWVKTSLMYVSMSFAENMFQVLRCSVFEQNSVLIFKSPPYFLIIDKLTVCASNREKLENKCDQHHQN